MSDSSEFAASARRKAMREAFDVGIESADGCLWVVIRLDVGDTDLQAAVHPADSEVLLRDLRGGVTLEKTERARLEAAVE